MRQSRNSALAVRLGLTLALAATSTLAQQPAPPSPPPATQTQSPPATPAQTTQQQPPRFTTEANYVRVDVYPSRNGVPATDLRAEDFDLLENGVRQKIEAFEHVVITPAGAQAVRAEPNSVQAGEQMAGNPRTRVFAIFLDIPHVDVFGSYAIKEPVIHLLDRILGPADLVAVMTTEMSASQITFGRKTEVIADMLRDKWYWGVRDSSLPLDQRETDYENCFPPTEAELKAGIMKSDIARKLIARRRERMVLDSMRDLVRYLGSVREERKAIIAISPGWVLYRPDSSIETLRVMNRFGDTEPVPGNEGVGVGRGGKLRVGGARERDQDPVSQTTCDKDRMFLANIDDDDYFRELMDTANRNNASFYPVDPRGLAAFDSPMGPDRPPTLPVDASNLSRRMETLRTLADNTDGIATVNTNDLERGLKRVADDLSSYYLLGYYSTNAKLDGEYRRISVKVKQPGVEVRARRGYRAATAAEVNASRSAVSAPVPDAVKATTAALGRLGRIQPNQRFMTHVAPVFDAGGSRVTALWVAGEILGPRDEFLRGGRATIAVKGVATGGLELELRPGERTFLVRVPVDAGAGAPLEVESRVTPPDGTPYSEVVKLTADVKTPEPVLFKRGLSTGNRLQPMAQFEASRTDRLQLQLPLIGDAKPGTGRLLDRNGQPLQIPVQVGEKQDPDGQRWLTADAILSALGAGDYVAEVNFSRSGVEQRVLTAIRVTR